MGLKRCAAASRSPRLLTYRQVVHHTADRRPRRTPLLDYLSVIACRAALTPRRLPSMTVCHFEFFEADQLRPVARRGEVAPSTGRISRILAAFWRGVFSSYSPITLVVQVEQSVDRVCMCVFADDNFQTK